MNFFEHYGMIVTLNIIEFEKYWVIFYLLRPRYLKHQIFMGAKYPFFLVLFWDGRVYFEIKR